MKWMGSGRLRGEKRTRRGHRRRCRLIFVLDIWRALWSCCRQCCRRTSHLLVWLGWYWQKRPCKRGRGVGEVSLREKQRECDRLLGVKPSDQKMGYSGWGARCGRSTEHQSWRQTEEKKKKEKRVLWSAPNQCLLYLLSSPMASADTPSNFSKQTPTAFCHANLGRPVIVKLYSGVSYQGTISALLSFSITHSHCL